MKLVVVRSLRLKINHLCLFITLETAWFHTCVPGIIFSVKFNVMCYLLSDMTSVVLFEVAQREFKCQGTGVHLLELKNPKI